MALDLLLIDKLQKLTDDLDNVRRALAAQGAELYDASKHLSSAMDELDSAKTLIEKWGARGRKD